ncbi:hypothetical protein LG204_11175 [Methylovorus menthalis]|uniref:hypothetical protein n=1 Tax=Methylovorus menthalis TaxID=1002227 RepID=UPI001E4CD482|nr:hypothetical protein [Methylovorus menthalis]MCB4811876.1 hypothetical protein [Methylovorus menthalis]
MQYSQRLNLLYGIALHEMGGDAGSISVDDGNVQDAAHFLACYLTVKAIQLAERSPADERVENFDMLSVYQAYAMLVYTYLVLPLGDEGVQPDFQKTAVTIAKSLFVELAEDEWLEIIESGQHKYQLIGDAEAEHWMNYRQDLDKAVVAFVVAGTDENAPFSQEDILPIFGTMLSMLCEAFESL